MDTKTAWLTVEKSLDAEGSSLCASKEKQKYCGLVYDTSLQSEGQCCKTTTSIHKLIVDWNNPRPEGYLYRVNEKSKKIHLATIEGLGFCCDLPDAFFPDQIPRKIQLIFTNGTCLLPPSFEKLRNLEKEVICIPLCGLFDSAWHDGWIIHMSSSAEIRTLIPPGMPGKAYLKLQDPMKNTKEKTTNNSIALEILNDQKNQKEIFRQAVISSLRHAYSEEQIQQVTVHNQSMLEALYITLLVQAFPNVNITCSPSDREQNIKIAWKKFCRGIGVQNKAEVQKNSLRLNDLSNLIPKHWEEAIRDQINSAGRIFAISGLV
ncbi:MAG: hypothetical protein R3B45_08110 [Bdellovibrionota bacterium]